MSVDVVGYICRSKYPCTSGETKIDNMDDVFKETFPGIKG